MEEDFELPEDMFEDNPEFIDTSHEFDDDCGDACKIWFHHTLTFTYIKLLTITTIQSGKKKNDW